LFLIVGSPLSARKVLFVVVLFDALLGVVVVVVVVVGVVDFLESPRSSCFFSVVMTHLLGQYP